MRTYVIFQKADSDGSLCFDANADIFNGLVPIKILSLNNGTIIIEPMKNQNIKWNILILASIAAGCFDPNSNLYGIKRINFTFNGINISVTEENAIPEKIIKEYNQRLEKSHV